MGKRNLGAVLTFDTLIAAAATLYVEIPKAEGVLGLHIQWNDATSDAAITFETTNEDPADVPGDLAGSAWHWFDESATVTIVGPTGVAADCSMKHLSGIGADRMRLKIVAAANTRLRITANWRQL